MAMAHSKISWKKRIIAAFLAAFIFIFAAFIYIKIFSPSLQDKRHVSAKNNPSGGASILTPQLLNKITSGYSISQNKSLTFDSIGQSNETAFTADAFGSIAASDGVMFTTESPNNPVYQRLDVNIKQSGTSLKQVNVVWEGRSNRPVEIFGWSYTSNHWIKLGTAMDRVQDHLSAKIALPVDEYVKEEFAHLLVGTAEKTVVLPGKIPGPEDYDFTFTWLTDTQYYSNSNPKIFDKMTRYIADTRKQQNTSYVIHTGDIVDNGGDLEQWKVADSSMSVLEKAGIPYGVLAGNHDVAIDKVDYTNYSKYFGEKRFSGKPYFGGTPNDNRDHYDLISSNGMDFIIVYLGWSIEANSFEWANKILKQHPNRKAIIAVHSYIRDTGAYVAQGTQIYNTLVEPNKNVFMVLCGHYWGTACNVKSIGGRLVYEVFANYQTLPEAGSGYLRQLHFDTKNKLLYMNTYSPYLNDYKKPDNSEQLTFSLNDETGSLKLETDWLDVKSVNP